MSYPYSSPYLEGRWSRLKLAKLFHPGTNALCDGPTPWRMTTLWLPTDIETAGSQAKLHKERVRRRYGVALTHFSFANALATWSASTSSELSLFLIGDRVCRANNTGSGRIFHFFRHALKLWRSKSVEHSKAEKPATACQED
jgi:hypothetical protein